MIQKTIFFSVLEFTKNVSGHLGAIMKKYKINSIFTSVIKISIQLFKNYRMILTFKSYCLRNVLCKTVTVPTLVCAAV